MSRIAWAGLALCLAAFAGGCSQPTEIKTAAQLQLEAMRETQLVASSYGSSVDRLLAEGIAIIEDAQRSRAASTAVNEVVAEIEQAGESADLVAASDKVALKIVQTALTREGSVELLDGLRQRHQQNLELLIRYLQLLQRGQELIVEYLLTDIGPTTDQLIELGAAVENLDSQLGGGGS